MPFVKGKSGNPSGRARGQSQQIARLALAAREHSPLALRTLVEICRHGESHAVRLAAANSLLDRAHGKPSQTLELTGDSPQQLFLFADMAPAERKILHDALRTIDGANGRDEPALVEHDSGSR